MNRTIRAIIFDMDGLMIDSEPIYWDVERQLAKQHNTTVSDATLRRMMGRGRAESMRIFAEESGIHDATVEQLLEQRERMLLGRYAAGVPAMPGLHEIIRRFESRLKLAVATSAPRKFADLLLPALGISGSFDVVQTGDDVQHAKPDPEIYLKTASRLEIEPTKCVVLEDSHAGALAGHLAGAYVIAVPSELTAHEDFSFTDAWAANLHEAAARIEGLLGE